MSRIHEKGEKLLHAIRSDLLLRIARDLYHFECQIEKDGKMVFRMLEYDIHIALTHGKEAREKIKRELSEFLSGCGDILAREKACGILSENAWKDIREFLWKACGHLLEKDSELYEEVSAEVEPAIKLSREIIQELQEDIQELQGNNQELRQELEKACRELIDEAVKEGKSMEETVNMTMRIFSLTRDEAEARVKEYQDACNGSFSCHDAAVKRP